MGYYEDIVRSRGREPHYEELLEQVTLLEYQARQREQEQRGQEEWERIQEKRWWPGDPKEIEEPEEPEPARTCGHLKEGGRFCGSLALTGRDYCRFHLRERGRRLKMARARARGQRWLLELPPLEDLHAVQVSIMQVLQALAHQQLDRHTGGLMLYGLQQAATNLKSDARFWTQPSRFELAHDEGVGEYDSFEVEFDLPKGLDPDTPPEMAFPESAEPAVDEDRADVMVVTPLDIDLMEIQQREGAEGVERKLKQLDAAEQRRYQRAQAQVAHARHVVRAAAQNAVREVRAGAPPSSAAVADRVGTEPIPAADGAARKSPEGAVAEAEARATGKVG